MAKIKQIFKIKKIFSYVFCLSIIILQKSIFLSFFLSAKDLVSQFVHISTVPIANLSTPARRCVFRNAERR